MSLLTSALGAAGSIFGGISASKAMRKAKENINAQRRKNRQWYEQRYNEDATQRADAQRLLTRAQDMLRRQTAAAAGSAAVGGATDESVAQAKAASNAALADAVSNINAQGERRKDAIEQTYQRNDDAYVEELNNIEKGRAAAIGKAAQGVASAAGELKLPI